MTSTVRRISNANAHWVKGNRAANIAYARELLGAASSAKEPDCQPSEANVTDQPRTLAHPCPCCGGRMIIIETFARGCEPTHYPTNTARDQDRYIIGISE